MIRYIKLHLNYIFSDLFIICFSLIFALIGLGIIISSGIDLGYYYLDAYQEEYIIEYIQQSFLIIEIILTIVLLFITNILTSKTNDYLMIYYVSNYKEKFMHMFSRLLTIITINCFSFGFILMFFVIFTTYLTPFSLNIAFILKLNIHIILQTFALEIVLMFLNSLINHFLVLIIPIIIFWYIKTLIAVDFTVNRLADFLIKIIPAFKLDMLEISVYHRIEEYLIPLIILIIFTIIINLFKDCK